MVLESVTRRFAAVAPTLPEDDRAWDRRYGAQLAAAAALHFSDLAAVVAASDFLAAGVASARGVVDLGAGAGKFVVAAAARYPALPWIGVDFSEGLIAEAEAWRTRYGLPNAHFLHADLLTFPLAGYGGAYVFNPFGGLLDPDASGGLIARGRDVESYRRSVLALRQNLRDVRAGFRLVTYFCEEGQVPAGYERVWAEEKLMGWEFS